MYYLYCDLYPNHNLIRIYHSEYGVFPDWTIGNCVLHHGYVRAGQQREPVEEPGLFHRIHVSDHILCQYVCAGVYKDAFGDGPENTGNGSGRIFWI